ncbi:MAG: DUF429 domain-containing protein [Owenweeksia sp.]|nr:DUF429 domain-containing protein [Owenweeksia sp.]
MYTLFGIDFGSKLTGNTVIAIFEDPQIIFMDVDKGVDADEFISNAADHFKPKAVFIDAPLSLPGVYRKLNGCNNYHFRKADIELNAMSPMFLGGLAARAIELKHLLEDKGIQVYETYPRIMAERISLRKCGYKGSTLALKDCRKLVLDRINPQKLAINGSDIKTWHHLDALLALMSALNHQQGSGDTFGVKEEGLIYV